MGFDPRLLLARAGAKHMLVEAGELVECRGFDRMSHCAAQPALPLQPPCAFAR
jgi:hypothetical protein